jgi:heme/copper-type cytochrome/quinol oxidase subunit 3
MVLVSSGVTVTLCHHYIILGGSPSMMATLFLGAYFTCLQGVEYLNASFSFGEGTYGSLFFLLTGFHGLHVLGGSFLLFLSRGPFCYLSHSALIVRI